MVIDNPPAAGAKALRPARATLGTPGTLLAPVAPAAPGVSAVPSAATAVPAGPALRRPLPEQVRELLEQQILTGALKEGDQIVEYQVARQMGISQTPVREALRTLESDGLLVTLPHRGTFVRRVSRQEAAERYSLGMELEAFAARLALPRLTGQDFRALEQLLEDMATAAGQAQRYLPAAGSQVSASGEGIPADLLAEASEALARTVELNVAFHRYLVERAGHELLLKAWLAVTPLNWRFVTYTRLMNPDPVELAERHRSLIDAYRSGDQVRAAAAIRQHVWEVAERVLPNIPEDSDSQPYGRPATGGSPSVGAPVQRSANGSTLG